ncbi:hypothetical protein ACYSNR_02150 [Enterococcus sp. LJL128]|uniref:hypothetical protein n=1 Tax=Enterococcus sp. LJL51 TaxID=3416656 RepID=UPI003CE8698D
MTNKIQFPRNYDRFIELGKEAANQENYLEAIDYFEEAYAIRQEFPLNYLLVSVYVKAGENKQGLALAEEMREQYLSCLEYMDTFVQLLILNQRFISAHSIVNEQILKENCGEMRSLVRIKKKIRQAELLHQQFEVKKINALKEELAQLKNVDYYQQLALIRKSVYLPQKEFVEMAQVVLVDKAVHKLVRSWVLEELAHLHYKKEVTFLWRDGRTYQVVPASLTKPLETSSYQRIKLFLEKELLHDNHILYFDLQEEVQLHFALLYPFSDKLIKDPKLWAMCYIHSYSDSDAEAYRDYLDTEEAEQIKEMQQNVRFELAGLNA